MANYKNQNKIINISVDKIRHDEGVKEPWMRPFQWSKMKEMMYLLSGNEYKFYMYLFSWAGKEEYEFSPADLAKRLDFGEDTARKIFKHFIDLGFLIKEREHIYRFDAYPEKAVAEYNKKWTSKNNVNEVV